MSAFPAASRHWPAPSPSAQPLVPPTFKAVVNPQGWKTNPAGHSLNSVMRLFQEPSNWTQCSHWVGTGNLGSSLEDTLCSLGQCPGPGSDKVASSACPERVRCWKLLYTQIPPRPAGGEALSGREERGNPGPSSAVGHSGSNLSEPCSSSDKWPQESEPTLPKASLAAAWRVGWRGGEQREEDR